MRLICHGPIGFIFNNTPNERWQEVMQIETTTNGGQHGRCRYKRQTEASLWHGQFEFTARNRKRKRKGSTTKTKKKQGQAKEKNNSNRSRKARTRYSRDQQSHRFDSVVEHFLASDEHSPVEAWDSLAPTTPHYSMQKEKKRSIYPILLFFSLLPKCNFIFFRSSSIATPLRGFVVFPSSLPIRIIFVIGLECCGLT